MASLHEKYLHWLWGENQLRDDKPEYLINLEYGVSIRFDLVGAFGASFEDFYDSIADIQFLTGARPDKAILDALMIDAWNYLALEERQLEEDISGMKEEDFDL